MRYMQMIKRCKLPLKKATSDVEAHGEEHAKRCKLSTAELKPSVPSVDERLGHLKNSAVARLLVEGRLPAETVTSPNLPLLNDTAMDLSKSSVLGNVRSYQHDALLTTTENSEMVDATAERLRMQMGAEMEALKKRGSSNEVRFAGWKCRYCPFTAHSAKKLYSHYQFHQQLLTSQSSKPHLEWLSAYRQSKDHAEGNQNPMATSPSVSSSQSVPTSGESAFVFPHKDEVPPGFTFLNGFPKGAIDAENLQSLRPSGLSLRYLLGRSHHYSESESTENSASGCLRSIVQEVMKKDSSSPTSSGSPISPYSPAMNGKMETSVDRGDLLMQSGVKVSSPQAEADGYLQPRVETIHDQGADVAENETIREWRGSVGNMNGDGHGNTGNQVDEGTPVRKCIRVERLDPSLSVPQRPLSRESTSSCTSSTTSEEINVIDVPSQQERPRMDSIMSDSSEHGSVRLTSRKRSHSVESEKSSLCSPTGHPSGFLQVPRSQALTPSSPNSYDYPAFVQNSSKSPRMECEAIKRESMDTRSNHSPTAVISSTGTPPPMQWSSNGHSHSNEPSKSEPLAPHDKLESSIQCELLVPPSGGSWQDPSPEMFHQGGLMEYQYTGGRYVDCSSVTGCIKCPHCGIAFDDSVLHSIHMGCHSHSDPFICNVCGDQCYNKYGFYTHIMRGHQSS